MIPLSRTARTEDAILFGVNDIIQKYVSAPKKFTPECKPRYKFWDYTLALRLANENIIDKILDIGFTEDIVYQTLLRDFEIGLKEVHYKELNKLSIRENKYKLVTCFGILEHVELKRAFFLRLLKYVSIDGILLITTDNENIKKNKKRTVTSKDLIELSLVAENLGYEIYDLGSNPSIDYLDEKNNELMSLVLRRVGR